MRGNKIIIKCQNCGRNFKPKTKTRRLCNKCFLKHKSKWSTGGYIPDGFILGQRGKNG